MTKNPIILVRNSYNADTAEAIVFSADGEEVKTSRANARDLVTMCGYFWNRPADTDVQEIPKETVVAESDDIPAVDMADEETQSAVEESTEDKSLAAVAKENTGSADIPAFLGTFSGVALRNMLEERYGIKAHHRTGKNSLIDSIVSAENTRLETLPEWGEEDIADFKGSEEK